MPDAPAGHRGDGSAVGALLTGARRAAATALLADLVRIPSVNTSREQGDRDRAEAAVAAYLRPVLEALGMTVTEQWVRPGRPNLIARWDGPSGRPPLTFEAHLDTVGVDEMTIAPFGGEVRDDCLWGRGACDTKGSLAAFVSALRIAREEGWQFDRPVQLIAVMGEETGCEGSLALVEAGVDLGWVVVGEPTGCEVVVGHKGCLWLEVVCRGRSTHGSLPQYGDSAIARASRVVSWLEGEFAAALQAEEHPLLGHPTVNVGRIAGGEKVNVVPARCRLEVDHRILPATSEAAAVERCRSSLHRHLPADAPFVTVAPVAPLYPGFELAADAPLAALMLAAARAAGGSGQPVGVPYFSDAGPFHTAGQPVVVFGPGEIREAHGPEEFVPLGDLHRATTVTLRMLENLHQQKTREERD